MRNIVRVAAVLALALCFAGAGYAKKDGKDVGPKRTSNPTPVLQGNLAGTVIFQEGFNDATFPPLNWIMINNDGAASTDPTDPSDTCWYQSSSNTGQNPLGPQEGSAFAAAYYGTCNGFLLDDWLVTPNTGGSAPAGSVDSLVFWFLSRLSTSGSYPDSLDIRVSTTNTAVGSFTRLAYLNAPKTAWTRVALLLPQAATRYVAFRYLLYDGGPDGANSDKVCLDGVQIIRYTSTAVGDDKGLVPGGFALSQNYPNPFNPSTQIEFALPKSSYARLVVFDALGREVATLVDGELSAGSHVRNFDAAGLAGGVYFYRLSAGTFNESRQMLLVK
jgi:hypothetical protein